MGARQIVEAAVHGEPSGLYIRGTAPDERERIVAAAIRDPRTGDAWLGDIHYDCFASAAKVLMPKKDWRESIEALQSLRDPSFECGFWTSNDRFVDRREGLEVAKRARQGYDPRYSGLDSRDLVYGA